MKKTLLIILLGAFGIMVFIVPALATTSVSFTPVNMNVRQGQTFILTIGVNPQGVKNYTIKTELRYPADLLEVKSFTFANGWMPLSQPGYDLIDNANGVFIKTAGYPGGVSSAIIFGTASFLAKKSGNGIITLNNNSLALDAGNQNVLTGASAQTAVTISAPVSTKTIPKTPTTPVVPTTSVSESKKEKPTVLEEKPIVQPIVQEQITVLPPTESRSLLASLGSVITLGTNSIIVGILVIVIILALVGYVIYAIVQRARRKNFGKL